MTDGLTRRVTTDIKDMTILNPRWERPVFTSHWAHDSTALLGGGNLTLPACGSGIIHREFLLDTEEMPDEPCVCRDCRRLYEQWRASLAPVCGLCGGRPADAGPLCRECRRGVEGEERLGRLEARVGELERRLRAAGLTAGLEAA